MLTLGVMMFLMLAVDETTPPVVETITVTAASRRPERIVEAPASVSALTPEEIERHAADSQAPRLVAAMPGVQAPQSGLFGFEVNARGFNSFLNRRVLTLIDGRDPSVPIFGGAQIWASFPFPLDELAAVEFVRGPGAALYGSGAYNGVLNMVSARPRDQLGGAARITFGELSTIRGEARVAGQLTPSTFGHVIAGRFRGDDFTRSRVTSGEYAGLPHETLAPVDDRADVAFASLRLDHSFGNTHVLTVEGGQSLLDGILIGAGGGRLNLVDTKRPWARVNLNAPHWNAAAYYTGERSNRMTDLGSGAASYLDTYRAAAEVQWHGAFSRERLHVVAGVATDLLSLDTADPAGRQTILKRHEHERGRAVFGQLEFTPAATLKVVTSARWDDTDRSPAHVSPRAAVVWEIRPRHSVRVAYGNAFLRPTLVQRALESPVAPPLDLSGVEQALAPLLGGVSLGLGNVPLLLVGNEDLVPEEIDGFEAGCRGSIGRHVAVNAVIYRNRLKNFVSQVLPQLGTPFGRVNPNYGPYRPPAALSPAASAAVLATLESVLGPTFAFLSNDANGKPVLALLSFTNFGRVRTEGVEVGATVAASRRMSVDLSYTFFDFEVTSDGGPLAPNAPRHAASLGVTYAADRVDLSATLRHVSRFDWRDGFYVGEVPSYEVLDATASWRYNEQYQW
jgi:outer membrane receptor protein involved in Fe transport